METENYDVAVIGAGMAGAIASRDLIRAGKKVILIEATGRIGGRIYTKTEDDGCVLELGATWVGPGQNRMYKLLEELGLKTFPQQVDGNDVQSFVGETKAFDSDIPPLPFLSLLDLKQSILRTDHVSKKITLNELSDQEILELDGISSQTYLEKLMYTESGKSFYAACIRSLCCVEPDQISAYNWLESIIGDMEYCLGIEESAQQDRIVGGASQIPNMIINSLITKDNLVTRFSCPINKIITLDSGLIQGETIIGNNNNNTEQKEEKSEIVFTAKSCVIAVPPRVMKNIEFSPPLNENERRYFNDFISGSITKIIVRYSKPWWIHNGYSGNYFSDKLISFMCDVSHVPTNSSNESDASNCFTLVVFVVTKWNDVLHEKDIKEREKIICQEIYDIFKIEDALTPSHYYEQNWNKEKYSLGCYSDIANIGFFSRNGLNDIFQNGVGKNNNIFFCCSELAKEWSGYMEGAYCSAENVIQNLLKTVQF